MKFCRDISPMVCGLPLRSVGSKPQARFPSLDYQNQERHSHHISCEEQCGFCPSGRDGYRHNHPLNGPTQSFVSSHLPWALVCSGGQSRPEFMSWRFYGESHQDPFVESSHYTGETTLHWQSALFHAASIWRETITPPTGIPVTPPCGA